MPRYAKSGTTREELTEAIMKLYDVEEHCDDRNTRDNERFEHAVEDAVYSKRVRKDLSKIEFDFENITVEPEGLYMPGFTAGFDTIHDFAVLWVGAGGDWEQPLAFCLYLDNEKKLRGYVPTEGNFFDVKHKAAWGNYDEEDGAELLVDDDDFMEKVHFDMILLRKDAINRIQPV